MLRKITIVLTLALLTIFSLWGCDTTAKNKFAPISTPAIRQAIESEKKTVIFFLDPNSSQCQRQDAILKKLHSNLLGRFNLIYISSISKDDTKAFYEYGIEGLPSLVLVYSNGKIAFHFPPGIQSYDTVAMALAAIR